MHSSLKVSWLVVGGALIQLLGVNAFLVALTLMVGYGFARPTIEASFVVLNLYLLVAFLLYLKRLRVACRQNRLTLSELANLTKARQKDILGSGSS